MSAGVSDYSIFLDEETLTLFAVQELAEDRRGRRRAHVIARGVAAPVARDENAAVASWRTT